jgi:hypothetical protein
MTDEPPRRHKQLSADFPQHWLDEPWFLRLSDDAKLLYLCGLAWAVGRTDGKVPSYALTRLHPDDLDRRARAVAELVQVGKWKPYTSDGRGWRYPDWTNHQSTVEYIEYQRERKRRNQADSRANRASPPVTGDVTGDVTGNTAGEYLTSRALALKGSNHSETLTEEQRRAIVFPPTERTAP